MVVIESAGITDVGMKRKGNEDALFLDDEAKLYVVADGMGGHQAGEVASGIVVDTMRDYMQRFNEDAEVEEMADFDENLSKEANRLLSSIHLANLGVNQVSHTKESYRGMGSTVSAVYFTDETLIAANVGDSPIYLVHNGTIERLSVLHTVSAEHAALDPEGAQNLGREYRHMLTRAMGVEETVEPDVSEISHFKGDTLVISSDGLSDKVSPEKILDIVTKERPEKACQALVDLANERGGEDNVTVIVLKVKKHRKAGICELITPIKDLLINLFKKTSN
ncbi:PP2C family protein-serine/threonine phosphatase [Thermodesulfobacteriota bacterium]